MKNNFLKILALWFVVLSLIGCHNEEHQAQIRAEYQKIADIMAVMQFTDNMPETLTDLDQVENELNTLSLETSEMKKFREKLQFRFYYQRKVIEMNEYMSRSNLSAEEEEIHEKMMTYITDITPELTDIVILEDEMAEKYGAKQN